MVVYGMNLVRAGSITEQMDDSRKEGTKCRRAQCRNKGLKKDSSSK